MSSTDTDSETDSLGPIQETEELAMPESPEEQQQVDAVRTAVREWKTKELNKNTAQDSNTKSLQSLRSYVANAGRLYYDLLTYLKTAKNKEQNMKDSYYVNIIGAIGPPGALAYPVKVLLENLFERDLVELPFTLEPTLTNSYAQKGITAQKEFPDEE